MAPSLSNKVMKPLTAGHRPDGARNPTAAERGIILGYHKKGISPPTWNIL